MWAYEQSRGVEETAVNVLGEVAPHVLWIVFLMLFLGFLGRRNVRGLLSRVSKIRFPGFVIELAEKIEEVTMERGVRVTDGVKDGIAGSLGRLAATAPGARVLWIDPAPEGNAVEIGILTRLGAAIDLARDETEARGCLRGAVYDVVLSNMNRRGNEQAGAEFIEDIRDVPVPPPVIFYVGRARPKPPLAFGITRRPDELFRLIERALEREV